MEPNEITATLAELLRLQPYYNVATSHDDQPWNSPVWAIADADFTLYWSSWVDAVHSRNLAANPRAFLTLYDSTRARGTNNFRCLYLQCSAGETSDPADITKALALLYPGETAAPAEFQGTGLKRIYQATPERAWLNCLSERQLTPATLKMRTEIGLEVLRSCAAG